MAERHIGSSERGTEALENAAAERSVELKRHHEEGERHNEAESKASAIEKARTEAGSEALFSKEYSEERKQPHNDSEEPSFATKPQKETAYKQTMRDIQTTMKPTERAFSKIIHNPVVERVSDITGATIARPNALLFGSLFAFIGVLALYMYARYVGFALSGFDTIAAFIIGWVIGQLVDFFRIMIVGKN